MENKQETDKRDYKATVKKYGKKTLTLIKNLICLLAWIWVLYRIIDQPFPFTNQIVYISSLIGNTLVKLILSVSIIITILVFVFLGKTKFLLKFIFLFWLRLIFFPFVAFFYVFYLPISLFKYLYKGINSILNSFVRTSITKSAISLVILVPASIIISLNSVETTWQIISIVFIILSLLIILRSAFFWTSKPLIVIEEILSGFSKLSDWYLKLSWGNAERTTKDPLKKYESMNEQLKLLHKGVDWLQGFVERNTDQRVIVKFFFFVFSTCFLLSVISFGILYHSLVIINPQAFANTVGWGLLDYIYASLLVITTSGELTPVWYLSKIAIGSEIFYGISLLSLLIFQFSMISIPEVIEKREHVLNKIIDKRDELNEINLQLIKQLPQTSVKEE